MNIPQFLNSGAILSVGDGRLLVGYGEAVISQTIQKTPSFVFPKFFFDQLDYISFEHTEYVTAQDLVFEPKSGSYKWSTPNWRGYKEHWDQLQNHFLNNDLIKAVPYVQVHAKGEMDVASALHAALHYHLKHPTTYLYGYWNPTGGLMGVTPELFLNLNGSKIETMACAGTCPAHDSGKLLTNPTLIHEHDLVISGITQSLAPFGNLQTQSTFIKHVGPLAHLVTPITLHSHKGSMLDIVKALHPTPALGAYPKESGNIWLQGYAKTFPRNHYGAPVGAVFNDQTKLYVAIRGIEWKGDELTITAGSGVIPSSQFEHEKNELLLKLEAIKKIISG